MAMAAVEDVVAAGRADPAPPPVVLASALTPKQSHLKKKTFGCTAQATKTIANK